MKRVYSSIANTNYNEHVIDIVIEFYNIADTSEVAAATIKHPVGLSPKERWSDEQLTAYSDFIASVESMVGSRFEISNSYQSKKSYAYYIDFKVPVDDIDDIVMWTVRFRIADHEQKGDKSENLDFSSNFIFKSITIGDNFSSDQPFQILNSIRKILNGLAVGDFNVLYTRYKSSYFVD